jgi:preprotein translocase subunit SecD
MSLLAKPSTAAVVFLTCITGAWAAKLENPGVKFEVRRAETKPAAGLIEATVAGTKTKIYLHKEAAITNKDIARAEAATQDGKPAVNITFTEEGRKRIAKLTEEHQGKPLALMVDGKVISAPFVQDPISGDHAVLSGNFTKEEAERIAKGMTGR